MLDNGVDQYSKVSYQKISISNEIAGKNLEHTSDNVAMGKNQLYFYEIFYDEDSDLWYRKFEIYGLDGLIKSEVYGDNDGQISVQGIPSLNSYYIRTVNAEGNKGVDCYGEDGFFQFSRSFDFISEYYDDDNCYESSVVDSRGNIHVVIETQSSDDFLYMIFSEEEKLLYSERISDFLFLGFRFLPDGSVAYSYGEKEASNDSVHTLLTYDYCFDFSKNEKVELSTRNTNDGRNYYMYAYTDDKHIVYANNDGLFYIRGNDEEDEILYRWVNHGMSGNNIVSMCCGENNSIRVVRYDTSYDCYEYFVLEPTVEEREVFEVEFAVSSSHKNMFTNPVADFNKKNPGCIITIKDDYDKTALVTKLISGSGPVIIDTDLVGFVEQKKLWSNLDNLYSGENRLDQMAKPALDLGMIDGEMYALVTDFYIQTLVASSEMAGWTYEDFISEALKKQYENIIYDKYNEYITVLDCFGTNVSDSFFVKGSQDTVFGDKSFDELLNVLEKYKNQIPCDEYKDDFQKILCRRMYLRSPEEVYVYAKRYKNASDFVGYPSYSGAYHRLKAGNRIAIRKTASEKEKRIAEEFLMELLSYESQKSMIEDIGFSFSVRKDVLSKQIANVKKGSIAVLDGGDTDTAIYEDVDVDFLNEKMDQLLDNSIPIFEDESSFESIIYEEFGDFLAEKVSREDLKSRIESRVKIYLSERYTD